MVSLGTDIDSKWEVVDGDLKLVEESENVVQSMTNRLNTPNGNMQIYYYNYGSFLRPLLGEVIDKVTLDFIGIEIKNTLLQDPRLQNVDVDIQYENKKLKTYINCVFNDESDLSESLVITEDGILKLFDVENDELVEDVEEDEDGS